MVCGGTQSRISSTCSSDTGKQQLYGEASIAMLTRSRSVIVWLLFNNGYTSVFVMLRISSVMATINNKASKVRPTMRRVRVVIIIPLP